MKHGLRHLRWLGALLALSSGSVLSAAAQDAPDRAFFDALLVDLSKAATSSAIPDASRCAGRSADVLRLCENLLLARRTEYSLDGVEVNKAREQLERVVLDQPKWPVAWYALAMIRVQASRANTVSREGPLQPMGTSNEYGAGLALIRAIELDSSFVVAREALAVVPTPREGGSKLQERLKMLRNIRDDLSGMGKYGVGLLEFEAGNSDSALVAFRAALRDPKIDRGMVRLAMARTFYRLGQSNEGRTVLMAGANDTSTASRLGYRQLLGFVASPAELAEWDALKSGDHGIWFQHFWANRDASEGLSDGARLAEHFKRFEYALKTYALKETQVGQQTVSSNAKRVDLSRDELSAKYFTDLRTKILAQANDTLESTGLMVNSAITRGAYQAPFRSFRGLRDKLDDRGIVYVRFGAPDKEQQTGDEGGVALWLYNLPDGPMTIAFRAEEFSGNAGPTRMVPHLYDLPASTRNKFCQLRPNLCATENPATASAGGQASTRPPGTGTAALGDMSTDVGLLRREAEEGIRNINKASTEESFHKNFPKALSPAVQVVALDKLAGGSPRIVAAFAIPGNQLNSTSPPEAEGKAVYAVRVQLALVRELDAKRFDIDTLRVFANPKPMTAGEFLSGMSEFALSPGTYTGSLILSQDGGPGAVAHLAKLVVPEENPGLSISSLVLGRVGTGLDWSSGTAKVPLNPLNTFKQNTEANVYYQVRGMTPGQSYDVTFDFFKGSETAKPDFTVSFKDAATVERAEYNRIVAFPTFDPARYTLRVTIKGDGKTVTAKEALTVVKS